MKTKTKDTIRVGSSRAKITDTTLPEIGMVISKFLDIMVNHPAEAEKFRQIFTQTKDELSLHAANDLMSIHFSVKMEGGTL